MQCNRCGKSFKIASKLERHNNRQNSCRPASHRCDGCSKGYASYQSLWKHRRICTGQKRSFGHGVPGVEPPEKPRDDSDSDDSDLNFAEPPELPRDSDSDLKDKFNHLFVEYSREHKNGKELAMLLDQMLERGLVT